MVLYIDVKSDRRTVAVRIRNVEIIGASFFNGPYGAGIGVGALFLFLVIVRVRDDAS